MTIEEKLKNYILTIYKSVREFVQYADIPYSTMDGILKRGIKNASIGNILKICEALQISADELANDRIVPINRKSFHHEVMISEIPDMISVIQDNEQDFADFTIDGQFLTKDEWNIILNGLTVSVEFIRQQRKSVLFIREPRRFERCDY